MITQVRVERFKSIESLDLELGRLNVLIGENGSGKSNVLEAIAFAAGASANRLDHEFLASRGIRSDRAFMFAAFDGVEAGPDARIRIRVRDTGAARSQEG